MFVRDDIFFVFVIDNKVLLNLILQFKEKVKCHEHHPNITKKNHFQVLDLTFKPK